MALAALSPVMNLNGKGLHPFFSKQKDNNHEVDTITNEPDKNGTAEPSSVVDQENAEYVDTPASKPAKVRKPGRPRKSDTTKGVNTGQTTLGHFAQRPLPESKHGNEPTEATPQSVAGRAQESDLVPDPNEPRRKRRKVSKDAEQTPAPQSVQVVIPPSPNVEVPQTSSPSWREQLEAAAHSSPEIDRVEASSPVQTMDSSNPPVPSNVPSTPVRQRKARDPSSSPSLPATPAVQKTDPTPATKGSTPKKKVLRLKANGKFSSPVGKASDPQPAVGRRKSKRESKKVATQTGLTVVMRYGRDAESRARIGGRIENIQKAPGKQDINKAQTPKKQPALKNTHPFFLGKQEEPVVPIANTKVALPAPSPRKSAVTPGKLRAQANLEKSAANTFGASLPPPGRRSNLIKHPGAKEPPWPWKGVVHVRDIEQSVGPGIHGSNIVSLNARRSKGTSHALEREEDLLERMTEQLRTVSTHVAVDGLGFPLPPTTLRIPERLLTNGDDIAARVLNQLSKDPFRDDGNPHPAVVALATSLSSTMTAFDLGTCETRSWTAKYAPSCSQRLLHRSKAVTVMRQWLQSLKVQAVDTGVKAGPAGSPNKKRGDKPAKKRRKKLSGLDDFIAPSDDDLSGGEDLTEPEDEDVDDRTDQSKSWVRSSALAEGRPIALARNIILISGPHGCGKTASVYAAAKELQFEVFEINPGSRRAGKDLIEKIGDMTENHLVNHRQTDVVNLEAATAAAQLAVDSDTEKHAETLKKDIASGRQGTMTAFFMSKPAAAAKPKIAAKPAVIAKTKSKKPEKQMNIFKKPAKSQKQSLILLEEVDVLFSDDKGFWATVVELAAHSRRPIVMTCSDENLVPFSDVNFEAILRFTPPPVTLATDYLLLIAAKEGHILAREAVEALYRSKGCDLRASITDLNFWCQMAVGDRRGGLDWIYQRWPPGRDVDAQGKPIRVGSQGTYTKGMGWISRDMHCANEQNDVDEVDEMRSQLWENWNVDPQLEQANSMETSSTGERSGQQGSSDVLASVIAAADALSAADVYSKIGLPDTRPTVLEATQPAMAETAFSDFATGYPILQSDYAYDYEGFDLRIAITTQRLANSVSHTTNNAAAATHPSTVPNTLESTAISSILHQKSTRPKNTYHKNSATLDVFEPLHHLPPTLLYNGPTPRPSFDRPFSLVTTDILPYVRSICASDLRLEALRDRLSGLLSAGGKGGKRGRTTRASRSALEGGRREHTRKERHFYKTLNYKAVLGTAGESWAGMGRGGDEGGSQGSELGSLSQGGSAGGASVERREGTPRIDEEE